MCATGASILLTSARRLRRRGESLQRLLFLWSLQMGGLLYNTVAREAPFCLNGIILIGGAIWVFFLLGDSA